jgi:hypothetical protein
MVLTVSKSQRDRQRQQQRRQQLERAARRAKGADKRTGAAYHEAGHAVMGLTYGAEIDHVSLNPSVWAAGVWVGHTVSPIHVTMLVTLAGYYAEARFRNDFDAALPGVGSESDPKSDYAQCLELAFRASYGDSQEADRLMMEASEVAYQNAQQDDYWRAVEAVAKAVLEREDMSPDEVKQVVTANGGLPRPAVPIHVKAKSPHPPQAD